ncbi:MAG: hypothetical protein OEZ06_21110 [Myxococcales bacterium]|nr:hypothetical protein [Myxococcales bacterium]
MKRVLLGILSAFLVLGLAVADADAQRKKKKKGGKKKDKVPISQNIAKSMGKLQWGMSKAKVVKLMKEEVKERYRPLISKTHDAVEEDRLRRQAKAELQRIKDGYVEFEGRSTGWDVSFLKGEFTHNNDEAMLVTRDGNSQNFYFFIGGRLWKWYKAFDASVFPANNFNAFAGAVQHRFGDGKVVEAELRPGEARKWLEWQDENSRLRAIDQTGFYGFYCLVFEDKATVAKLASLRSNRSDSGPKTHALVEAVTGARDAEEADDSPNVVDRLTGRIRAREDAPEPTSSGKASGGKKGRGRSSSSSSSSSSGGSPVDSSDDPLQGLGL